MNFILDIDGVVLDLVSGTRRLAESSGVMMPKTFDYHDLSVNKAIYSYIDKYNKEFTKGNMYFDYPCIYDDFLDFLASAGMEKISAFVTAKHPKEIKILRSRELYGNLFRDIPVFFTSGGSKVDIINTLSKDTPAIFIDDNPNNVLQANAACHNCSSYLMSRDPLVFDERMDEFLITNLMEVL